MITPQQRQQNLSALYAIKDGQARLQHLFNQIHVPATIEVDRNPGYRFINPTDYVVKLDSSDKRVPDLFGLLVRLQDFSGMPLVVAPDETEAMNKALTEGEYQPEIRASLFLQQEVSDMLQYIVSERLKRPDRVVGFLLNNFTLSEELEDF